MVKYILFGFLFINSFLTFGQFSDGSGWAILSFEQSKAIEERKKWWEDKIHNLKILAETKKMISLLNDSKAVIGTVSSTMNDLKSLTKEFQNDLRGVSGFAKDEVRELNELISFKDAMAGKGYGSIFNLTDWYKDETARFRGRDGNINVAATIMNAADSRRALDTHRAFRGHFLKMGKIQSRLLNMEVLENLEYARYFDRLARKETIKLNLAIFKTSSGNIYGTLSGNEKSEAEIKYQREELSQMRRDVLMYLTLANEYRMKAFQSYNAMIALQQDEITIALQHARLKQIIRDDGTIKQQLQSQGHQTSGAVNYLSSQKFYQDWKNSVKRNY